MRKLFILLSLLLLSSFALPQDRCDETGPVPPPLPHGVVIATGSVRLGADIIDAGTCSRSVIVHAGQSTASDVVTWSSLTEAVSEKYTLFVFANRGSVVFRRCNLTERPMTVGDNELLWSVRRPWSEVKP